MLAIQPEDVRIDRLPVDPDEPVSAGVYGVDPRKGASAALGAERLEPR